MSERFVRLPGSARRYIDTLTGEEISRRERDKRVRQVQAERFVRLPGTARRYLDTITGEEISRREYDKRRGVTLPPKRRPQAERSTRIKPFPASKILPDEYFLERKKTHRWFMVRVDSTARAPKRAGATQRFQIQVVVDIRDPKTNVIYPNVRGYSSITYKWWFNYNKLVEEACHSASHAVAGVSTLEIVAIKDISVITRRFLTRSKRNEAREKQLGEE